MTSIQQVEPASGNSVAEKRVDFAYNTRGQYASIASITRWADITQTDLVAATTFKLAIHQETQPWAVGGTKARQVGPPAPQLRS